MEIKFWLNGQKIQEEIQPDMLLLDLLREKGCYSVKGMRNCKLRSLYSTFGGKARFIL